MDRDGLRRSVEDQLGHGPAALRNVQSVIVRVDGATELEQYWNFDYQSYQHVWSVTKSILSALSGHRPVGGDPHQC